MCVVLFQKLKSADDNPCYIDEFFLYFPTTCHSAVITNFCPELRIRNSRTTSTSRIANTTGTIQCSPGYQIAGTTPLRCAASIKSNAHAGQWQGDIHCTGKAGTEHARINLKRFTVSTMLCTFCRRPNCFRLVFVIM